MVERETSLASLVKAVQQQGYSYREMADRARRHGHLISHSQLADYAAGNVAKAPTAKQIEALAAALDMGVEAVRSAVFEEFYGYIPRELGRGAKASKIAAAVPHDLSAEDEEQLVRMIQAWLAARRGE